MVSNRNPKPLIIPVFIPHHGCPHRCAFCDQQVITAGQNKLPSPEDLCALVDQFIGYARQRPSTVQLAFFGGNFLGLAPEDVRTFLSVGDRLAQQGKIDGIRFSTRPDTIDDERLERLNGFKVTTVELGVQSMDDHVLALSGRGHTAADTISAVDLLKRHGYEIGLQMMMGLPGDDEERTCETGRQIAGLSPNFVRIYPTVVLKNSKLADWYQSGKYRPPSLSAAVTIVKRLFLYFRTNGIPVARTGLQASESLGERGSIIAGPYHPAFGHLVQSELFLDMGRLLVQENCVGKETITFRVHPGSISKMRGHKNRNIETLKNETSLRAVNVAAESLLPRDGLRLAGSPTVLTYDNLRSDI